jgi:hypothetical protein
MSGAVLFHVFINDSVIRIKNPLFCQVKIKPCFVERAYNRLLFETAVCQYRVIYYLLNFGLTSYGMLEAQLTVIRSLGTLIYCVADGLIFLQSCRQVICGSTFHCRDFATKGL